MKKFENKETKIQQGDTKLRYSDLIGICLTHVNPQSGIKADEMYKNFKILDKLEAATTEIELEDAEYDLVLSKVTNMSWAMQHRDIVAFVEAIKQAK